MLVPGFILFGVFTAVTGWVKSWYMLLFARVVTGAGEGTYYGPQYGLSSEQIPKKFRSLGSAIINSGMAFGIALGLMTSSWLVYDQGYSWRMPFYAMAIPSVLVGIAIWLFVKEKKRTADAEGKPRNGGITRDHFLYQTAHGFQPKRQRDNIKQQQFAVRFVADQNIRLNRRANGDDFVRVNRGQRGTAKKFANALTHQRHAGGAADHYHFQHLLRFNAGVFQRATAGHQGTFYQWGNQIVKLATADIALPAAYLNVRHIGIAQGDFRRNGGIQQLTLQTVIATVAKARLLTQIVGQQMVEIIAAESGITAAAVTPEQLLELQKEK